MDSNNTSDKTINECKKKIAFELSKISKEYKENQIDSGNLDNIRCQLKNMRRGRIQSPGFDLVFSSEHMQIMRKFILIEEKCIRILALKILRYLIDVSPNITVRLLNKMYPVAICRQFEDYKQRSFDERLECFKFINSWFKHSGDNLPLIFCQGIASMAKGDEYFKKGAIEFLRSLAIKKPDYCSTVGGFRILINALIDENCLEICDNIFFTLLYIINNPQKRKFFNGFADFYKIFAIFTKSDFTIKDKDKEDEATNEQNKLENQLELSKNIILKLLKTWPGYSLIMGDKMAMGSVIESLNTDTSYLIKKNVLVMLKEIIESDYLIVDNFSQLTYGDDFYLNKISFAYILQGLHNNNLYESLIKFIEKENNTLSDEAHKIALKFTIIYSKLSNVDLQLPYLNEKLSKQKQNELHSPNSNSKGIDEEVVNMKVKIMHLLDQTFYHFNCRDFDDKDIEKLSTVVIKAMNTVVNLQSIKKYNNQYSIESSKKELYRVDDESLQQILKSSKIVESKEFKEWDWVHIEEILDIVENWKEITTDLYKKKFFKRLIFAFMPSNNLFVKLLWNSDNFTYASVGTKFFKILSSTVEGNSILNTSPEENYFMKNKTWYEDVQQCLENLLNNPNDKEQPFTLERISKTMSRQIFVFLGVISQSSLGEAFLEKKKFYEFMVQFVSLSNKYDYILTNLIDNINFNSKKAIELIQTMIEKGSNRLKLYVFEHMKCLLKFGRDFIFNFKTQLYSFNYVNEVNLVIISILTFLMIEGHKLEIFVGKSKEECRQLIQKLISLDKDVIYIMMRTQNYNEELNAYIQSEISTLNVDKIIDEFGTKLEENMNEIFSIDDTRQDNYFLNINLPKIENQYDNMTELFWLKQLPFNINVKYIDFNRQEKPLILNTYMESCFSKKLVLYSTAPEGIKVTYYDKGGIKVFCALGHQLVDANCKVISNEGSLTFDGSDFESIKPTKTDTTKNEVFYKMEKEGIVIILSKNETCDSRDFFLYSIYIYVRIRPEKKTALKTPINILTELGKDEPGTEKLFDLKIIEHLFSYLSNANSTTKHIKAALWILAKICTVDSFGSLIERRFNIIEKILNYNATCEDYAMKGTISYILCYISKNKILKPTIEEHNYNYFFNTDICYPKDMTSLYMKQGVGYENKKIKEDGERINKLIVLTDKSNEIFLNVTGLLNALSYKQSFERLTELKSNTNNKAFNDPNLLVKIYALLSRYKCRQTLRKCIFLLFESALSSQEIADSSAKLLESIGLHLFESVDVTSVKQKSE